MTTNPASRTRRRAPREAAELDASTPRWPEIALTLTDPPSITVSGVTTALTGDDPQWEAVHLAARHAANNGRPIRMRVTTPGGVQRVIVTADHRVVPLDTGAARVDTTPAAGAPAPPPKTRKASRRPRRESRRVVNRFPRPVRWSGLVLAVLAVAALVVIVGHGRTTAAADTETAPAPVPQAGELTTELPPPGWSPRAGWVLPIAAGTVPATDPASGVTAAITPDDRSTADTAGQRVGPKDRWLSVLEPDGRTRYAVPLDDPLRFGPVITDVDGVTVALIATADQVRYWPLTGGTGTDVDLPTGAHPTVAAGESVLFTLPGDRVGYLHDGAVQVVPLLPRTDPGIAVDGAVVLTQPDTGAWWTVHADAAPTSTRPTPPAGAAAVQAILGVTARHVILAWTPTAPDPKTPTLIVVGYDRATGRPLATTTTPAAAVPHTTTSGVVGNDQAGATAAGPVVLTTPTAGPATLVVVPGFTATLVADRVYGTVTGGKSAVADADGTATVLPEGTLTPTGTGGRFLPVVSQDRLYALHPAAWS